MAWRPILYVIVNPHPILVANRARNEVRLRLVVNGAFITVSGRNKGR